MGREQETALSIFEAIRRNHYCESHTPASAGFLFVGPELVSRAYDKVTERDVSHRHSSKVTSM